MKGREVLDAHCGQIMCQEKGTAKRWWKRRNTWNISSQREKKRSDGQPAVKHDQLLRVWKMTVLDTVCMYDYDYDLYPELTVHSHMVQESFFHRSPSVRSRPSRSVQSVLLRRASSFLIYKETIPQFLGTLTRHLHHCNMYSETWARWNQNFHTILFLYSINYHVRNIVILNHSIAFKPNHISTQLLNFLLITTQQLCT